MSENNDTPTYEISSFQDVLDKVPYDRIEVMMSELGEVLALMAATNEMVRLTAEADGVELPSEISTLTLPLVWKDDHKETHELTMSNRETGEDITKITIKTGKAAQP